MISFFFVAKRLHRNTQFLKQIAELPHRSPLNLSKQQLIDADMKIVVEKAIIGRQCIWLRLEENMITPDGISVLVKAFESKNVLEGLGLFGNQLSDLGIQILALAIACSKNKIKALGLGKNNITDRGIGYLVNMLNANRLITQLWLQKNQITDEGVQLLLDGIDTYCTQIREIDLSDNIFVTDASMNGFYNLIQRNETLKVLWIYGCSLTSQSKQTIMKKRLSKRLDLRV